MKLNCHVRELSQVDCDRWNMKHGVGTEVTVVHMDGTVTHGATTCPAWMLGGLRPSITVRTNTGRFPSRVYSLKRVRERNA